MTYTIPAPGLLVAQKYRLAARIGGGGMGQVFRAENIVIGRSVAIKFLHAELAGNADLAQRFFQEAKAVSRVRHPNIVDVLDAGMGEFGPFMVMEYLVGDSLGAVLARSSRLDQESAVAAAIPVLDALDAAHRAGIIHRDLKPENVFLSTDPSRPTVAVRLLDFGIAKVLDGDAFSPRTKTGVVFGTPDYLSPEQATGEGTLDGRSDLFSVGVLLYELLTGARPFRAPTAVATAFRVVHAEPAPLANAGIEVHPLLDATIRRLLEKDPARRFPNAGDVARELELVVPERSRRAAALDRLLAPRAGGPSANRASRASMADLFPPSAPVSEPRASRWSLDPAQTEGAFAATRIAEPARERRVPSAAHPPVRDVPTRAPVSAAVLAAPRSSSPGFTPVRSFPAKLVGRYEVRGAWIMSVDRAVTIELGADARRLAVAQLPPPYASQFTDAAFNALVGYELEALSLYMDAVSAVALPGVGEWRRLGRRALEMDLFDLVRGRPRDVLELPALLRRCVSSWSRHLDFGAWNVSAGQSGRIALTIGEFEAASLPFRLWIMGMLDETLRRATGAEPRIAITFGELGYTPELACEIG